MRYAYVLVTLLLVLAACQAGDAGELVNESSAQPSVADEQSAPEQAEEWDDYYEDDYYEYMDEWDDYYDDYYPDEEWE